jgi:Alginate export
MTYSRIITAIALATPMALALTSGAMAAGKPQFGDPIKIDKDTTFDPIFDLRLRWENVDQPLTTGNAVTARLRAGYEIKNIPSHLAFLVEAEGTLALTKKYNGFPFVVADPQRRPAYGTIADPENIELNRIQLQYKTKAVTLTVGRQRINLDDERFVGSVGWRQNEQTFDAVRGEVKFGKNGLLDVTYSDSQRTVFGHNAVARTKYKGQFVFVGAAEKLGAVNLKAFAYLLDYDPTTFNFQTNSSQTYGLRATTTLALSKTAKLALAGSYARQSNYGSNPFKYSADYFAAEGGLIYKGATVKLGYEELGSDAAAVGGPRSVQTPMATLHKFDGWADVFLTTPTRGLRDYYASAAYSSQFSKALPKLNFVMSYHKFTSDTGGIYYGNELDQSVGFTTGKVNWLIKYAKYTAKGAAAVGSGVNTRKLWVQSGVSF